MLERSKQQVIPHQWAFAGDKKRYCKESVKGFLPEEIRHLMWSLDWPVDPNTQNMHLNCFYDMPNCGLPSSGKHWGVDIQVAVGTHVLTPETGKIVELSINERQAMLDIIMIGNSGIYYIFGHLDWKVISDKFAEIRGLVVGEEVRVKKEVDQREMIGEVGYFGRMSGKFLETVQEDVKNVYGDTNSHLHIECWYRWKTPINPLLLFKRLS
ncbi:hypothetical protein A2630_02505 [Candidatus Woesebacteria bacterium RIFCSPHIGHO2_01_FULL_44_10]|uniref:Peptidase M23 domain-containing protein n=1 Tax=Candidatus Woesebacteria bacterium RIFCSPLOWO2_01_FULL_44_14 TaxID=1802525 RepID=A0A1F8C596_9BACT|nr:MAG: hypothetical protein A2630_02505 [Candidatus Woesebacteria bacterium RIFCSPHIGHO2_01_FULL_44_10]OGM55645.1 MAG: hypothetical protein A3F62_02430 [Candidatus Woesebacteria bacterium RIFCSPHIGHO2_12_FULL_44_11]OGM70918.1 MAG: hypothetical protein A2975_01420 [Candidatus Woesebacteria bacterium RIFCSPLOWO2_01_FULL_44_14]